MNEITAAIRKKAEERYSNQTDPMLFALVEISKDAYTCGGEDAIGFMLKFVEWTKENYSVDSMNRWFTYKDPDDHPTTEQLLLKFLEQK